MFKARTPGKAWPVVPGAGTIASMSSPKPPHLMQRAAQGHIVEAAKRWHADSGILPRAQAVPGMPADAIQCAENLIHLRELALLQAVGEYLKQL